MKTAREGEAILQRAVKKNFSQTAETQGWTKVQSVGGGWGGS